VAAAIICSVAACGCSQVACALGCGTLRVMNRVWIVSTVPVAPASPSTLQFGSDSEAARANYISQITALGAPSDVIAEAQSATLTLQTTLQYTDPTSGTRVILTTARV